jgi:RNA polymerase sigma-70 factor (ECF subfamily)
VLGDRVAAEDVVQEVWIRWQRVDRGAVKNPAAFLTTATTHLAINVHQSARHRHESPTDLPGCTEAARTPGPAGHAERAMAIEAMLGFLMARLTASELAAYLLRRSFDYPYPEIAALMGTSATNARQLVRRAQAALGTSRARRVNLSDHRRLVTAFAAATSGEMSPLERILTGWVHRCPTRAAVEHPLRQAAPRRRRTRRTSRGSRRVLAPEAA